jgi:hypothetical protein
MYYRQELVDLTKDTEETQIMVDIAGFSLVPGGDVFFRRVIVDDSTEEGKKTLKDLLSKGYYVESVK